MLDPETIPVPERMQYLPRWRGFVVHFTVGHNADGSPNFRAIDEQNKIMALGAQLCHLCGRTLGKPMCFIGGPKCEHPRTFVDGPMHEECALYAIKTCPFLNDPHGSHAATPPKENMQTIEAVEVGRPAKMGLFYSNGYTTGMLGPHLVIQSHEFIKIDWDAMPKREE